MVAASNTAAMVAYAIAAAVLPVSGRRLPSWDNLVALSRVGLLVYGVLIWNGPRSSLEGPPSIWLPLDGMLLIGCAVLLTAGYRHNGDGPAVSARDRVLAALPPAVTGLAIAIGAVLVPEFQWAMLLPLCAIIASATLIASARFGSWRPYVAPAVVASLLVTGLVAADVPLRGGIGDVMAAPTSARGVPTNVRRAVGDVDIDLTGIRRADGPVHVHAEIGIGNLHVTVPYAASVVVDVKVGRGTIDAAPPNSNRYLDSVAFSETFTERWVPSRWYPPKRVKARAWIVIDGRVGLGDLVVTEPGA
jgi:hypothetical protein